MRFYVAGKWEDRYNVRLVQTILINHGHEITCDWTPHGEDDLGYPSGYAIEDINGVVSADMYIGLFRDKYDYKGALVEMGVALGCGIPVYIAGDAIDSCLFVYHPLVKKFDTIEELLKEAL